MPEYFLGTRSISLRPSDVVGKGGEADIYRKSSEAFKVFKPPTHPDLAGTPSLQKDAEGRIREHQTKLLAFPKNLPARVTVPEELLRDKTGLIVGYKMNFIDGVEVLLRYGERSFRDQGVSDETVRDIFIDLYKTVLAIHRHPDHVVIGDFNDLNVLVKNTEAHIIDADSMQFGKYPARMFTGKFVDPLICDPKGTSPMMVRPHSPETDWYAYLIMLMQSLLFVGPYGGVYRPKDQKQQIQHDARSLKRITVFNPEVRYPKPARPFKILPDELLQLLVQTFEKDKRGAPPLSIIEGLEFTKCSKCGITHARNQCPDCVGVTAPMVKEVHTGKVKATKLFETSGPILYAAMQRGKLRYLYHEHGTYRREGGKTVVTAPLDPNIRHRIKGSQTIFARFNECLVFEEGKDRETLSVDAYGSLPLIDANEDHVFFAESGGFYKTSTLGAGYREKVGDVLQNQTLFWVGDALGFGFYRAAELSNFFVFSTTLRGLNDSVKLPGIQGQLVDATAVFGSDRVWFFTTTQERTKAVNRCYLVNAAGVLLGEAQATPGDGTWLGSIRGACAVKDLLFVPTDDGVVRVGLSGTTLTAVKEYPDTQRFVDDESRLFIGNDGLTVVNRHEIWRLVIG